MSGWKLTAALLGKHASLLGDKLAEGIASFDPQTATEVDREKLQAKLKEVAQKLAAARHQFDTANQAASALAAQITTDEKASEILIGKFDKKELDEATLTEFANNLEAEKARLPGLQADATDAKQLQDTLQQILDTVQKNLNDFDAHAHQAMHALEQARADREREQLRAQNQAELSSLASGGAAGVSSGLSALQHAAEKARVEADATKIVTDINQQPIDRQAAVEEARKLAAGTGTAAGESVAERLRRIAASGGK